MAERIESSTAPQPARESVDYGIPRQQRSPHAEETTVNLPILKDVGKHISAEQKSRGTGRHRAGLHASNEIQQNPTGLPPRHAKTENTTQTLEPLPPIEDMERANMVTDRPQETIVPASQTETLVDAHATIEPYKSPNGSAERPFEGDIVEEENHDDRKDTIQPEQETIIDVTEAKHGKHKRTNPLISLFQRWTRFDKPATEVMVHKGQENGDEKPAPIKVESVDERTLPRIKTE